MTHSYAVRLRAIYLALVTLVIASSSLMAQWSSLPPLPAATSWSMQTVVDNKLYVFGGVTTATTADAYVLNLNDVDAGWLPIASMPETRYGGYAAAYNGKIYIIAGGAIEGGTINARPTVLEYDPA